MPGSHREALRPRTALRHGGGRLLLALLLSAFAVAFGARITIDAGQDPTSRLEIRTITLPGGEEVQLYVLSGDALTVHIDDSVLEAQEIEVDLNGRLVRVIGPGRYETETETVEGNDLTIDLRAESFTGDDVVIINDAVQVTGDRASRVPGLIRVAMGSFSPCTKCGQELDDYGFDAKTVEVYPGDRIVAYGVTVLIRGAGVMYLPMMVLPIGPPDRLPRFEYVTGTATERARISLSWPYVAGADAYGDVGVRYYADVTPGEARFADALLGGKVDESYVGGFVLHRFYTERGKGQFSVDYTPAFGSGEERTAPVFKVRFAYADEESLALPRTTFSVSRDDEREAGLWELSLDHLTLWEGWLRARVSSRLYLDTQPTDALPNPSYARRSEPLMTLLRLQLEPDEIAKLDLGILKLSELRVDMGVFEDRTNSINRSAAAYRTLTAARLVEAHTLSLSPLDLWSGMTLDGSTAFTGYYYSTSERQVDWSTTITARQEFGVLGNATLKFSRVVREGETPFRFDVLPYSSRTELRSALDVALAPWLRFRQTGGYVVHDERDPSSEGWIPLTSTATFFEDVDWVSFEVQNEYDIEERDPGTLDLTLGLRYRSTLSAELELKHSQDLAVRPDRLTDEPVDTSKTSAKLTAGVRGVADISVSTAFTYFPPAPEPGEPLEHFDDLNVKLTIGNLRHDDRLPGLALTYGHDLNRGQPSAFEVSAVASLGPVDVDLMERLSFPTGRLGSSRVRVAVPEVASLQVDGLLWLPPTWIGLPEPEPYPRNLAVTWQEERAGNSPTWQVKFSTRIDPRLPSGQAFLANTNSVLTGRVVLADREFGATQLSVDGFAEVMIGDSVRPAPYLRRANLQFGVTFWDRVGLQGTVGYLGRYGAGESLVTSTLTLEEVALIVRPLDDLYVAASLTDSWDLTRGNSGASPFNFQPKLTVIWNRCCWAVYGSWDSATGAVAVTLTTPGADRGLRQLFDTGWVIPRREL